LPQYPKSIRPPGGEAVVEYRINKEGRVTAVQFVEGNSQMQKGLEEALKKFVYRPFLVRGEPVEVEVKQKFVYEIR
jgi:TonB family protein